LSIYSIKFINIAFAFLVTLLLAKVGGPSVLGSYALAIQTAQLLTVLAIFGMDQVMIREVAGRLHAGELAGAGAHVRAHLRFVLPVVAIVISSSLLLYALYAFLPMATARDPMFLLSVGFLVVNAFYCLALALLRALANQLRAQVFEGLFNWPLALVLGIALLAGWQINAADAVLMASLCMAIPVIFMVRIIWHEVRNWGPPSLEAVDSGLRVGAPFMATAFLLAFSAWLPLFLAGVTGTPEDVGRYRVAFQLTMPMMVIISTTTTMLTTEFAGDFRLGRLDLLRARYHRSVRLVTALNLPMALPLLIWPDTVVRLVFGAGFDGSGDILRALVAGQCVMMLMGPAGAVMVIAGREKLGLLLNFISVGVQLALSVVLQNSFGIVGIAMAFSLAQILRALAVRFIAGRLMR
jgi:O-antigen/teichoic acid export membrane protein